MSAVASLTASKYISTAGLVLDAPSTLQCPRCGLPLVPTTYEKVTVHRCLRGCYARQVKKART